MNYVVCDELSLCSFFRESIFPKYADLDTGFARPRMFLTRKRVLRVVFLRGLLELFLNKI